MSVDKDTINALITAMHENDLSNDTLWDMKAIGKYMRLSVSTVQQRVVTIQGFPRAIKLPTTDNGGQRRWQPAEIKAWAGRHKEAV